MPTPRSDATVTPAAFQILAALADRDLHGYAIMQEVEARTGGAAEIGPATLYRTLKHLLVRAFIEERAPSGTERAKRTYRITDAGRTAAAEEARRLAALVEWASDVRLLEREG